MTGRLSWPPSPRLPLLLAGLALALLLGRVARTGAFRCTAYSEVFRSNVTASGELKSPNYGISAYPRGMCFSYTLLAGPADIIRLRLIEFKVGQREETSGCQSEFVDIYVEGNYLRRLCGDKSGTEIRGLTNITLVLYSVHGNYSALRDTNFSPGFRIVYEFQAKVGCGNTRFTSRDQRSGVIKSPGYDGSGYLPLTDCTYDIVGSDDERVVLNFVDVHLAESVLCYRDYISLKNIVSGRPTLLMENACGSAKIGQKISGSHWVRLKFHSSLIRWEQYRGFQLKYSFLRIEDLAKAENKDSRCGKDFYSGLSGVINSPSFPGYPSTSAPDVTCAWIIQVPEGWQILLSVAKLDFGKTASTCSSARLAVYDGYPTGSKDPKETFCVATHQQDLRPLVSDERILFIRFFAEAKSLEAQASFQLTYTAALKDYQDSSSCPGYLCQGAVQCRDSAGLSCSRLPRFCLHPGARCDGRRSCSQAEASDEENCVSWHYIGGVATGAACGAVIVALSAVLVCVACRGRWRRRRRQAAAAASAAASGGQLQQSQLHLPLHLHPHHQPQQSQHPAASSAYSSASNGSARKKSLKSSLTDLEMNSVISGPAATAAARAEPALKPILKLTFSDDLGHERSLRLASPGGSPIGQNHQHHHNQQQQQQPQQQHRYARVSNHYACATLDPGQVRYTPAPGGHHAALSPVGPALLDGDVVGGAAGAVADGGGPAGYTRKNSYSKIVEEESDHKESDSEGGGSLF